MRLLPFWVNGKGNVEHWFQDDTTTESGPPVPPRASDAKADTADGGSVTDFENQSAAGEQPDHPNNRQPVEAEKVTENGVEAAPDHHENHEEGQLTERGIWLIWVIIRLGSLWSIREENEVFRFGKVVE